MVQVVKVQVVKVEVSSVAKIVNGLVELTRDEAEAYYEAANELYDMYVEAADYVIENNLFFDVGIPFNLIDVIKKSWENDVHWHIYGRFCFNGGVDGEPIRLVKFDADAPQYLLQTAQEQYETLVENGIDEELQFNEVYERVSENFKRLITLFDDTELFEERYDGWKILFSSLSSNEQEELNTQFLQQMAEEAGFETGFEYLENTEFSEDGISDSHGNSYEYWYKHYKWLEMSYDEPELLTTLTNIMDKQEAIILNPAYTALFEAKGIEDILRKLYPESPYFQSNEKDESEITNVLFAYEACGISFEKDGDFLGHCIKA